jgi:hypothetical protein
VREQVTDAEILDAHSFGILASIYKVMPGVVTKYTPSVAGKSPASVDVQPGVHDVRWDTELGTAIYEPWPIIPNVPLGMLKGGGVNGFVIAFAMTPGDAVTLVSFDLDPTIFRGTGVAGKPVDTRRHGGGHWQALPFDITDPGALADPGAYLVLGGASDFVALASKCDANFADIKTAITTALTSVIVGDGGAGFAAALKAALSFPSVASAHVKTK